MSKFSDEYWMQLAYEQAELAAQQEQNSSAEKAQKTSGQSQDSKDYVPFSPAA